MAAATAPQQTDAALQEAHRLLLAESELQFDFVAYVPPTTPDWLRWFGDLLRSLGPYLEYIVIAGLVVILGLIAYFVMQEAIRRRRSAGGIDAAVEREVQWRPQAVKARALLADADRLAAQGRYAEAVHMLLYRSIDDIEHWRPHVLKPNLTSRDILHLGILPPAARQAFGHIARVVETSFFGRHDVDANDFADCRNAYARFALRGESA